MEAIDHGALTVRGFCLRYGVSRTQVYRERKAGRLKSKKLGKHTLIRVVDAEAWLAALPDAPRGEW